MTRAVAEEQIKDDQRDEKSQNRFEKPAEDDVPTRAERAPSAPFAREANREGRGAAGSQHAAVAAHGVSAPSAGADRELTARNAAGVGRSVAVREQVGHASV